MVRTFCLSSFFRSIFGICFNEKKTRSLRFPKFCFVSLSVPILILRSSPSEKKHLICLSCFGGKSGNVSWIATERARLATIKEKGLQLLPPLNQTKFCSCFCSTAYWPCTYVVCITPCISCLFYSTAASAIIFFHCCSYFNSVAPILTLLQLFQHYCYYYDCRLCNANLVLLEAWLIYYFF